MDDTASFCSKCGGQEFMTVYPQQMTQSAPKNKFATVALVFGILAIICFWIPYIPIVLGVMGLLFSLIAIIKRKNYKETAKPIIAIIMSVLMIFVGLAVTKIFDSLSDSKINTTVVSSKTINDDMEKENTTEEIEKTVSEKKKEIDKNETTEKTKNIDNAKASDVTQDDKQIYIDSCDAADYRAIERDPDIYKGKKISFSGEVIQVMESSFLGTTTITLRIEEEYDSDKTWYVTYIKKDGESRILEDDYVTVYGECDGITSYKAVLGNTITIPSIKAEYIEQSSYNASTAKKEGDVAYDEESLSSKDELMNNTTGEINALKKAKSYLSFTSFSKEGLIKQLEFEGFTTAEATFAVDNCGADWEEQAKNKAKDYLDFSAFSRSGLIHQLEYDGFSTEDAEKAADNCGADWNEQAARKAKDYMDYMSFSKSGLIEQLEYEGFTTEQAEYGASKNGY